MSLARLSALKRLPRQALTDDDDDDGQHTTEPRDSEDGIEGLNGFFAKLAPRTRYANVGQELHLMWSDN